MNMWCFYLHTLFNLYCVEQQPPGLLNKTYMQDMSALIVSYTSMLKELYSRFKRVFRILAHMSHL